MWDTKIFGGGDCRVPQIVYFALCHNDGPLIHNRPIFHSSICPNYSSITRISPPLQRYIDCLFEDSMQMQAASEGGSKIKLMARRQPPRKKIPTFAAQVDRTLLYTRSMIRTGIYPSVSPRERVGCYPRLLQHCIDLVVSLHLPKLPIAYPSNNQGKA